MQITRAGSWLHDGREVALTPAAGLLGCDVVFPALHGPYGEDGVVQGVLECLDVPYVGSDVASSALCIDKVSSKRALGAAGLAQVDYRSVEHATFAAEPALVVRDLEPLGLPLFVKPARMGSSVGIAKVTAGGGELLAALASAFEHDRRAIVEAAAGGLEVECSLLGNGRPRASQPGEIVLHSDFYDYEAKYQPGGMELVVPARISAAATDTLRRLAADAFELCGCSGLARADFFVDGETVLLNELNTMPGFTATSVYAKLWAADGLAYPELVDELCRLAIARHAAARAYAP